MGSIWGAGVVTSFYPKRSAPKNRPREPAWIRAQLGPRFRGRILLPVLDSDQAAGLDFEDGGEAVRRLVGVDDRGAASGRVPKPDRALIQP